jgi:hypothetical protein
MSRWFDGLQEAPSMEQLHRNRELRARSRRLEETAADGYHAELGRERLLEHNVQQYNTTIR